MSIKGFNGWDQAWPEEGASGIARVILIFIGIPAAVMIWRRHSEAPAAFAVWALVLLSYKAIEFQHFAEPDPLWMQGMLLSFLLAVLYVMFREVTRSTMAYGS